MSRQLALVTGVTGQDGAYLTEFQQDKGWAPVTTIAGLVAEMMQSDMGAANTEKASAG